jgi:hypothetical protein
MDASAGFELAIPAIKQLQTYVLNRTATGIYVQQLTLEHSMLRIHCPLSMDWELLNLMDPTDVS